MTDSEQSIDNRTKDETAIPGVDVLIAARDRADTIERAVSSALAQDEVRAAIVVDDGSADDTAARARRCDPDGKRLIVKRLPRSVGPSAARNIAIGISTAPWLAILDADDFFLPGGSACYYPRQTIATLWRTFWCTSPKIALDLNRGHSSACRADGASTPQF